MKKESNKAFTLIEISLVILIIGILIAAISNGSDLLYNMKVAAARSLTTSTNMASIDGMVLWVEPTLNRSFNNGDDNLSKKIRYDVSNNVESWNDINPNIKNSIKYINSTATKRPTLVRKGINGLPSVKFDGIDDYLTAPAVFREGNDYYTIVAVWQQSKFQTSIIWVQETQPILANRRGALLNGSNGTLIFNGHNNDRLIGNYTPNINYISIAVNDNGAITSYFNGIKSGPNNVSNPSALNIGADYSSIGQSNAANDRFVGLISEIMIFDRALFEDEVMLIEDYLSQKYAIKTDR